jgi:hypothetical protein
MMRVVLLRPRRFAANALARHAPVCDRVFATRRETFNSADRRLSSLRRRAGDGDDVQCAARLLKHWPLPALHWL